MFLPVTASLKSSFPGQPSADCPPEVRSGKNEQVLPMLITNSPPLLWQAGLAP